MKHLPVTLQPRSAAAALAVTPPSLDRAAPAAHDRDGVRFEIGATVEEAEKGLILRTLEHTRNKNNKTRAAEILGIGLKTLHNKLKEYGASKEDVAAANLRPHFETGVPGPIRNMV